MATQRSAAYLTILSDDLSPDDLWRSIGLTPDQSWRKGERQSPQVRRATPHNGITYDSQLPESDPSHDHLAALIARLEPHGEQIAATVSQPSVHSATLWLVEHTESDMTDITVDPEQAGFVAALGATLVASSYFRFDHDED